MIRSRLFGRFVRSVGRGAVLFGLLGVGAFYYDTWSVGRFCTCDWWKRGCSVGVGVVWRGACVTGVSEAWEWAWGRFVNMTAGSVGAFFINFSRVSVFERGWAWGVFSPMTDGSVGAFFIYF